ncbi:MAG: formate dehydrogenase accessory sulfurtransferase FdhD [Phenylobacterium sp.]|nr:MAG: formate dehydrogenase accessory sulfurtransferase FdhD [Phenylobacterium sp.]
MTNARDIAPIPVSRTRAVSRVGRDGARPDTRALAEETPVALIHDATTTAVMMATPADIEDFAVGFSLTEGIIADPAEIRELEVAAGDLGVEARMWLAKPRGEALAARRRLLAGPTGCGLCGVESLAEALRPTPLVGKGFRVTAEEIWAALDALPAAQTLGAVTRAVHAAGWWTPGVGFAAVREDVGRHNALDKLVGALARAAQPCAPGLLVLTSRVSVEMVQKAAVLGAQVLVAVSAPTTLAIATAERAGMTLIGVARPDSFEVFTRGDRVV